MNIFFKLKARLLPIAVQVLFSFLGQPITFSVFEYKIFIVFYKLKSSIFVVSFKEMLYSVLTGMLNISPNSISNYKRLWRTKIPLSLVNYYFYNGFSAKL